MNTFTAIGLPDHLRDTLAELRTSDLTTTRWVQPEDFHITLRFLGAIDPAALRTHREALRTVQEEPFDLTLRGIGRFPEGASAQPRVLWVGITPCPGLDVLQAAVSDVLRAGGLPDDRYSSYSPHVTLARLDAREPTAAVAEFLSAHAELELPTVRVDRFSLYQSHLDSDGPNYKPLEHYDLG
ncbi:MAG: RNA 2',3'-cyclic phosphodiesterase [Planctomycetota bacterium]